MVNRKRISFSERRPFFFTPWLLFISTSCGPYATAAEDLASNREFQATPQAVENSQELKSCQQSEIGESPENALPGDTSQKRLSAIGGKIIAESYSRSGVRVYIAACSMGKIRISDLNSELDVVKKKLYDVLADNKEITRIGRDADFEILSVKESTFGGRRIVFQQTVNRLLLEQASSLHVSKDGYVDRLNLYAADPNHADFVDSAWAQHSILEEISRETWMSHFGTSAGDSAETRYLIVYDESSETFRPALELRNSTRYVIVDAITGNTLSASRNPLHLSR